jgi:hypothetical protein
VAKCGLYGAINEEGAAAAGDPDASSASDAGVAAVAGALPSLRLLEPMRVLEARAYELQVCARAWQCLWRWH